MNRRQIKSLLFSGRPLKPDLFEFRADRGVYEDAGTDPAEDTDPVYQWNDQGPLSLHATQVTLANRPTLSSAASPNYVAFDGTDDGMSFDGGTVLAHTDRPWTFEFWVRVTDFTGAAAQTIATIRSNGTNPMEIAFNSGASYLGLAFGSVASAPWAPSKTDYPIASISGTIRHYVVTYNGAGAATRSNFAAYIDGVQQTLTAPGIFSSTTNAGRIGDAGSGGVRPLKGRIYKAAGFSRALTRDQVLSRLAIGVSG